MLAALKQRRVRYLEGRGVVAAPSEVTVDLASGGSETLNGNSVLIATGSRASFPELPGTAGKDLYTADTLWHLSQPPFVGRHRARRCRFSDLRL